MNRALAFLVLLVLSPQLAAAEAVNDAHNQYMRAIERIMVELGAENARASATVRQEYRAYLDHLVLSEFDALEDALYTGGLVPLPANAGDFNLKVRTEGPAPIAEKDLANQTSYIAARPATIGALLDIASRVKSGPLEITSLVRHAEYQDALRATNANANTTIPMHTMGLAFDIAVINTPLKTVYEIRDVLRQMQRAGDILFIGERQQLVFHVVPHPSRLGYFTDVYTRAIAGAAAGGYVIESAPINHAIAPLAQPAVRTEVISFGPTDDFAAEWWAAGGAHSDLTVAVTPEAPRSQIGAEKRSFFGRLAARLAVAVSGVVHSVRNLLA
jgi:hypothetical protein